MSILAARDGIQANGWQVPDRPSLKEEQKRIGIEARRFGTILIMIN
jgi:hypothetical protein